MTPIGPPPPPPAPLWTLTRRVWAGVGWLDAELELRDGVEALAQVRLDGKGVTCLGEDLQQLVVGQEVEAREDDALRLEVRLEALLDLVEQRVAVL